MCAPVCDDIKLFMYAVTAVFITSVAELCFMKPYELPVPAYNLLTQFVAHATSKHLLQY